MESLTLIEQAALAGADPGTRLEVVFEPTGPAWLPIAVFFTARGHLVFRVSSAKAADLRRFLSRHAKSNGIDADTLARLPLVAPDSVRPLQLPDVEVAALDRRVRAVDRLTRLASEHKVRIKDLVRQLMPMTPRPATWAQPIWRSWNGGPTRALLRAGRARLTAVIVKASHNHLGAARAEQWREAAAAAVELYGDHPAIAWSDLAAEIVTEVALLRAVQAQLVQHARRPRGGLPMGRRRTARPHPARCRRRQRSRVGRSDRGPAAVPQRQALQVLRRACPQGE
ncbi:MAG: transposase [Nocardioidaceae bacterium]